LASIIRRAAMVAAANVLALISNFIVDSNQFDFELVMVTGSANQLQGAAVDVGIIGFDRAAAFAAQATKGDDVAARLPEYVTHIYSFFSADC
jgi:hypothetical protein